MSRPTTYAKHVGRDSDDDTATIDLFAVVEPVKLARRKQHAKPHRPQATGSKPPASWIDLAIDAVRRVVLAMPSGRDGLFTMEQMRARLEGVLPAPEDLRTWGKVTVMLRQRNIIRATGRYAPAVTSNGSPKPIYRRGPSA